MALPEDPAGVEPEPSALAREHSGSETESDESAMETTAIEPEPKVLGEEVL